MFWPLGYGNMLSTWHLDGDSLQKRKVNEPLQITRRYNKEDRIMNHLWVATLKFDKCRDFSVFMGMCLQMIQECPVCLTELKISTQN
jgi:hypothetical protein